MDLMFWDRLDACELMRVAQGVSAEEFLQAELELSLSQLQSFRLESLQEQPPLSLS